MLPRALCLRLTPRRGTLPRAALPLLIGLSLAGCTHLQRLTGDDFNAAGVPDVVYARIVQHCGLHAAVTQSEIGNANPTYTYNRIFARCMHQHGFAAEHSYTLGLF